MPPIGWIVAEFSVLIAFPTALSAVFSSRPIDLDSRNFPYSSFVAETFPVTAKKTTFDSFKSLMHKNHRQECKMHDLMIYIYILR